jgi:DNA-binding LacI/PurR family transcriptional regulator
MPHRIPATNRRPTLKEVARLAGVSVSTASFVLSGQGEERRISDEVSERVRAAARERGYVPNLLVRSLQRGRTHVLSFYNAFGSRALDDLYMDRVSNVVEFAAGARGYDVLVHCAGRRTADEVYRLLAGGFSDGLLFYGPPENSELLDLLRASRLPTVLFNHADAVGGLAFVADDYRDGMRQVADRLVALGHTRIAAFDGWPGSDGPARIAALRDALRPHGITLESSRVLAVHRGLRTPDEGLRLLLGASDRPTALFCWHDRLGYETLEACDRLGVRVPNDLSLVGYDGLHWPSTSPHVLASVHVPLAAAAERAVTLLDDLLERRREGATGEWYLVALAAGTTLTPPPAGTPSST